MKKEDKKSNTTKPKKKVTKKTTSSKPNRAVEKILVENFIAMQKVMTELVSKFDKMEKKLSDLLDLFEESAKTIAEKEINLEIEGNSQKQDEIINNLKKVLDQNKLIAKGLTLMYDSKNFPTNLLDKSHIKSYTQASPQSSEVNADMSSASDNGDFDKRDFGQPNSNQNKKTKVMEEQNSDVPNFSI